MFRWRTALAALLAASGQAAAQEPQEYTGCLTLRGVLVGVAQGDTPQRPCTGSLTEITLVANAQKFPATGQTTCWDQGGSIVPCPGTGQDGEIQAGATLSYTDNGDGTITDQNMKLRWEKKDDSGSIHDLDNVYSFDGAFIFVDTLNTTCEGEGVAVCEVDRDCDTGEVCGFAGFNDWRVPNVKELQSLVNYEASPPAPGPTPPAASAAFDTGCVPECTIHECSCTISQEHLNWYWSSTTSRSTISGIIVNFEGGTVLHNDKSAERRVRAVRGGLIAEPAE